MKAKYELRGMTPLLPTAIQESGELDEPSLRRLVQYALKCGVAAIGHLGGASEYFKVGDRDRRRIIELTVEETAGRVPVYIGATATSTRIAAQYAREAEELGADMLLVATPSVGTPSKDELYAHYAAIADATSLPIIVQDTGASGHLIDVDMICRLHEEIDQIQYTKAEGQDFLTKTKALIDRAGDTLAVMGGAAGFHMIHLLRIGVTAFVTGTEALDLHAAVVRAYLEGDEEKAAQIYYQRMLPYLHLYSEHGREMLKAMLYRRGIIDCPKVIPPADRSPMSEIKWREFEWVLERIGLTNRWPDIP